MINENKGKLSFLKISQLFSTINTDKNIKEVILITFGLHFMLFYKKGKLVLIY